MTQVEFEKLVLKLELITHNHALVMTTASSEYLDELEAKIKTTRGAIRLAFHSQTAKLNAIQDVCKFQSSGLAHQICRIIEGDTTTWANGRPVESKEEEK